jgi:two-component system, response regulator YesN
MLKVLLVDDDGLVLEGLKQLIPWEDLGMKLVGAAYDGFSAIELAEKEKPDMIISDIAMPVMSGLEFARRAKEIVPDVFLVFLSGHEDFNYARQAIEMSAGGYLLKPVNYKEFTQQIREFGEIILRRTKREKRLRSSIKYLNNELLRQWLYGDEDVEAIEDFLEERKLLTDDFTLRVAVIELDDIEWKLNEYEPEERERIIRVTKGMIIDRLSSGNNDLYCKVDNNHIALISINKDIDLQKNLEELIEFVKDKTLLSITVGLGREVNCWRQAALSFKQAEKALSIKMFNGKGRVIPYSNSKIKKDENSEQHLRAVLDGLFECIKNYKLDELQVQLDTLFTFIKEIQDRMTVYNTAFYLVSKLDDFLHTLNEDLFKLLGIDMKSLGMIYKFETVEDVEKWTGNLMRDTAEKINLKKQTKKSLLIEKIEKYVNEHLEENITLKEVAEYLAISPNYLGFLFKEETGETFSNYIGEVRIKRVGELLEDPTLKVYEVADRLGYKNMTYFNAKFKEYFGVSPRDFRKKRG